MAWLLSRRNRLSFLTANTVAGPLGRAHRSGRATGNHPDPPTAVLFPRRTPHPFGPPPHPASAPALALGNPVHSRPHPIASHSPTSLSSLTARRGPPTRPRDNPGAVPLTGANPVCQCRCLPATLPISPAAATAGRHIFTGVATDTILKPICWHRAWPVRLRLLIIPPVNAHASSLRWIRA